MNKMGIGDPDPSNYKTGFDEADEIVDWFKQDKPDDGDNVTKLNIAKNLVEKIEDLLDGKAHYVECCDRTTQHRKIVIEYDHKEKCKH